MQQTSQAYKTEQKQNLREKSHVWVYLGIVDQTAQKTARITTDVTPWSKLPTGNGLMEGIYATYEQNFFRADGEMMFPPETWAMYQGAASESIRGAMKFEFAAPCNIRGLTLKFFEDARPTGFSVMTDTEGYYYPYSESDVDEHGNWSCNTEFSNVTFIRIVPSRLKGGNQRFRIQRILFGLGFYFEDKDLLSTSFTSTVSHLSDKLPSKTFSFTIDNTSRKFSADDPHSFVHFLQEQQEVDFDYGRELPDGTIETIKGGKTYLKTWTTDEQKATFNSVGMLDFMDTTYHKGKYSSGTGTSLWTLAERVFADAGITDYNMDESLKDFKTNAPLPVEKHKNLLQLIANAARCIFYEDRDGTLTIAPSLPDSESYNVGYTLDYRDLMTSPKVGTTEFVKNAVCHYYRYSVGKEYEQLAYIENPPYENYLEFSNPVDILGAYTEAVAVTQRAVVVSGITLNNGETIEFRMSWGYYECKIGSQTTESYDAGFKYVDKYDMEFINNAEDMVLAREIETNSIRYTHNSAVPLTNMKIRCSFVGYGGLPFVEVRGAYEAKFVLQNYAEISGHPVFVLGRELDITDSEVLVGVKNLGVDKTCRNPLINSETWATANRNWMADYYNDDVEYELEYRGEPALDCDDQIYLENNYVAKNLVRITETTINTGQGMTKSILKARRLSYHEYAKVDIGVVDVDEIK